MIGLIVVWVLAVGLTFAGSQGAAEFRGVPIFALCAVGIFALQWLAFVPAYLKQTERFYDLTGSLTYISAVLVALALTGSFGASDLLIALAVLIWAARLGSFLFRRISMDGADSRFDKIKPSPLKFFVTWNLQGLWVLVTAGAALAALSSTSGEEFSLYSGVGLLLWMTGMYWEVTADKQKRVFRAEHGGGRFITSGLWARSRHPNYFGEIMLWLGVAMMALPALQGWQYLCLISPLFVYVLLTKISGIPLLERKALKRWGEDPAYQQYLKATPELFPRLIQKAD